jgi:hypothetical protein
VNLSGSPSSDVADEPLPDAVRVGAGGQEPELKLAETEGALPCCRIERLASDVSDSGIGRL